MNNNIENNLNNTTFPEWQHPVLPGQALQGSLLLTVTDFNQPPQSSAQFIWKLLDDIIGVANVKIEYNEELNKYIFYKAKGHLLNNDEWIYSWQEIGSFAELTEETKQALDSLKYIEYIFENNNNTLVVKGKLKDGTIQELINISFVSYNEYITAITNLNNNLNDEITARTNSETAINQNITNLTNNLNDEITARTNSETAINQNITNLNNNIDNIKFGLNELFIDNIQTGIYYIEPLRGLNLSTSQTVAYPANDFFDIIFASNPETAQNLLSHKNAGQIFILFDFTNCTKTNNSLVSCKYTKNGVTNFKILAIVTQNTTQVTIRLSYKFYQTIELIQFFEISGSLLLKADIEYTNEQ